VVEDGGLVEEGRMIRPMVLQRQGVVRGPFGWGVLVLLLLPLFGDDDDDDDDDDGDDDDGDDDDGWLI